jgi:phosphoribosylaminoimidazole-succinocarboxamide synthase
MATQLSEAIFDSGLKSLKLHRKGKVRDVYEVGADKLLIVATDRLSAYDVILPTPIPDKGRVLTSLSNFWFARTQEVIRNHLVSTPLDKAIPDPTERARMRGRAVVAKRLRPLPVEAVVRGYLVGSGWRDYQDTGEVCGVKLPKGLKLADKLPKPIFTPSTKADVGHDENIDFDAAAKLVGGDIAEQVRRHAIAIYEKARDFAATRGIIIADTKMEFGLDANGGLYLIDELLTPDSSRFWPAAEYKTGSNPPSFDKQYVRDWLDAQKWNRTPPAPELPPDVIAKTTEKYREAEAWLTGARR